MRALRWHGRCDLRLDDLPEPQPGPGQVLLRVLRTGICGTDLEEYLEGPVDLDVSRGPVVLGHEVLAQIIHDGDAGLPEGTVVVPDVVLGCGSCALCARHEPGLCRRLRVRGLHVDGGLAELIVAESSTLVVVPPHVGLDSAALVEPLSVAVRALRKAGDLAGRRVAVVGAGTVGQLVVRALLGRGATAVLAVDPEEARRALALDGGATEAAAPEDARAGMGSFDIVVECAGTRSAVDLAFALVAPGGRLVLVGTGDEEMPFPVRRVVLDEIRVVGSAAHVWDVDVAAAVSQRVVDEHVDRCCVACDEAQDEPFGVHIPKPRQRADDDLTTR